MTTYLPPQQPTPSFGSRLGTAVGTGVGSGLEMLAQQRLQGLLGQQDVPTAEDALAAKQVLIDKGFPPEIAEIWDDLTPGGKSKFAEIFMDQMQRQPEVQDDVEIGEESSPIGRDVGLTPKESVARQEKRYDKNLPLFKEHEKKSRALETENMKIDQLQRLNNTTELPTGFGRLNVNFKTGELRLPFFANPETQLFVKTVNDFLIGAKDTFGSRVTNFEVTRFLKRLPTLSNSKEGRFLILRQMEIINELNQLDQKGVLNAFENAGGLRNIDYDKALREGRIATQTREKELKKEFSNIVTESRKIKTPKEQRATGRPRATNPTTGKTIEWTGTAWKEVK